MTANSKHEHPLSMAFLPTVVSPEHAWSVVDRALDFRAEASVSTRNRFNSAIKDSISVAGFRDASKAQRHQLREPVLTEVVMGENGRLAGAVLRTWAESNDALKGYGGESPTRQRHVRRRSRLAGRHVQVHLAPT